jgi:iron complex transport system permease protein
MPHDDLRAPPPTATAVAPGAAGDRPPGPAASAEHRLRLPRGLWWLALPVSAALAVWLGAELLWPRAWWAAVSDPADPLGRLIVHWRVPRALTAFCVGACLAVAGVVFQGLFRNPLAEPYLLGSASGASVGAAFALLVPLALPAWLGLPVLAFVGAWAATWAVVALSRLAGVRSGSSLILAGVAIAALLAAVRSLLMLVLSDDTVNLQSLIAWTLGGVQTPHWHELLALVLPLTLLGVVACLMLARGLDLLGLGDDQARSMGLAVDAFVRRGVLVAAAVTALAVVWGGLVGFVGLVVPHVLRWWVGPRHAPLLWRSALAGGALVMVFDGLARALLPPSEIPLGLLTALVGVPFFLVLLVRQGQR